MPLHFANELEERYFYLLVASIFPSANLFGTYLPTT
jgi:hypothetical protein